MVIPTKVLNIVNNVTSHGNQLCLLYKLPIMQCFRRVVDDVDRMSGF